MLTLKEQAKDFIEAVPDDKIIYIMDIFKGLEGFLKEYKINADKPQLTLLEEIKELRGIICSDIDERAELAKARDEKYASLS